MGAIVGLVAIVMTFSIPLAAIIGSYYIKAQRLKVQNGGNDNDLRAEVGRLMAENEEIKEQLRNIKYLLGEGKQPIDLDYEKEQIRMDRDNKFEY